MLQLARRQFILQQIKNRLAKILRRRNAIGKKRIEVQVGVIEPIQHSRPHRSSSATRFNHHSRFIGNRAAHQHLNKIIMPMAVRVVALSVRRLFSSAVSAGAMQPVAGAEHVTPAKIRLHASPLIFSKNLRRLIDANTAQTRAAGRSQQPAPAASTLQLRCFPWSEWHS